MSSSGELSTVMVQRPRGLVPPACERSPKWLRENSSGVHVRETNRCDDCDTLRHGACGRGRLHCRSINVSVAETRNDEPAAAPASSLRTRSALSSVALPTVPRSFSDYLKSFGPGIVIVLTWLGAGDIVDMGIAGANYG